MIFFSNNLYLQDKYKKRILSLMDQYIIRLKSIENTSLFLEDIMNILDCENNNFRSSELQNKDLFKEIIDIIKKISKIKDISIYDFILIITRDEYLDKEGLVYNLLTENTNDIPNSFKLLYKKVYEFYLLLDEDDNTLIDNYYNSFDFKIEEENIF